MAQPLGSLLLMPYCQPVNSAYPKPAADMAAPSARLTFSGNVLKDSTASAASPLIRVHGILAGARAPTPGGVLQFVLLKANPADEAPHEHLPLADLGAEDARNLFGQQPEVGRVLIDWCIGYPSQHAVKRLPAAGANRARRAVFRTVYTTSAPVS